MKPLILIILLILLAMVGRSQVFKVDSIGKKEHQILPLYSHSNDSVYCYNFRLYGVGKTRIKKGMIGTIVMRKEKYYLTFKK